MSRPPTGVDEIRIGPARVLVADGRDWAALAAREVGARLQDALARRPPDAIVSLALSGGSTPRPVHRALASLDLEWPRIDVFQVDERMVPNGHPDRNLAMIRETLLEPARVPRARIHAMPVPEGGDKASAEVLHEHARTYAARLPPALDVVLLGLGADGHTASLFPDQPLGTERVQVARSPAHAHPRLTLGEVVIREARVRVMLVRGEDKAAAVARCLTEGPVREAPGRIARDGLWILDREAARDVDPVAGPRFPNASGGSGRDGPLR